MELNDILLARRMVRQFTEEPLTDEQVERLVWAGLRAPSAGFAQGVRMLVLREPRDRAAFWATSRWQAPDEASAVRAERMREAPLLLVPLCSKRVYLDRYAEPDKRRAAAAPMHTKQGWAVPYWLVDAAFAAMLVQLEAVDLGLGALFMGVMREMVAPFRSTFGVPEEYDPIGVILVGHRHPDVRPSYRTNRRRPTQEMAFIARWGQPLVP